MAIHADTEVTRITRDSEPVPAELAEEALRLVGSDPRRAQRMAERAAEAARATNDADAEVRALRAMGSAARMLGRLDEALRTLRRAVRRGERGGAPEAAAEARVSLAYVLLEQGSTRAALAQAERAAAGLRGLPAARTAMQHALILQRCGRYAEALQCYPAALSAFRRHRDVLWEARLLNNRGLLHLYRGDLDLAEQDLVRAEELFTELGMFVHASYTMGTNLGLLAARRGDAPAALRRFDAVEAFCRDNGLPMSETLLTRVDVLLSVGLWHEACTVAEQAVAELGPARNRLMLAEALLKLAQAALAAGDAGLAREKAQAATTLFTRQRRRGWAALARYVVIRADEGAEGLTPALRTRALRTAAALAEAGWRAQELDARLIAARVALAQGQLAVVRREMRAAGAARRRGPTELRLRAWYAEALLRLATGNRRGAEDALRAGLRVVEERRAALGATELRAHVAAHGGELANLGLDLASQAGSPEKVLEWTERWRAGALTPRPVRPPADPELAATLEELRRVSGAVETLLLGGEPGAAGPTRTSPARLRHRKTELEEQVRHLARRAGTGEGAAGRIDPPTPEEIGTALGDRVLVEIVEHGGGLRAVTVRDGVARLHRLGEAGRVARLVESVQFALHRLARGHGSARSLEETRSLAVRTARRLDALLLAPVDEAVGDRPLVLVPPGSLHAVPWSMLPHATGRPVSVAPSSAVWLRAATAEPVRGPVVLACGPGLAGAAEEIDGLAAGYPDAVVLTGTRTRVDATLDALDGAALAHIAAHCHLHGDNPLFSALDMADGPLTVYDLERLSTAPGLVLLPACQSGVASVLPGNELMGLTSALLSLGTRAVVATVLPVPDQAAGPMMLSIHDALRSGATPAAALALAHAQTDASDTAAFATRAAFACFGAG